MKDSILLFFVLAASCTAAQNLTHRQPNTAPVIQPELDLASAQSENSSPPPYRPLRADLASLRDAATELASLAQSIPGEVDKTTRGMLPYDLNEKLKRIDKLSKRLRSQISQ